MRDTETMSDCVFCEISARHAEPSDPLASDSAGGSAGDSAGEPASDSTGDPDHVVFSDDVAIAFLDRSPLFVGHTLVVPRRHVVTMTDLPADLVGPLYRRVQLVAAAMPVATGKPGTFIANNNIVSQSVAHLHVHVIPRVRGDGLRGFFWPRERYEPGQAAAVASSLRVAIADIYTSQDDLRP